MLLDEIIDLAVDDKQSITVLLRKCLVLAYEIKNDRLRTWVNQELDGYSSIDGLPDYRIAPGQAKGFFNGPFQSAWKNWPIPPAVLEERHRKYAEEVPLTQAISAYEDVVRNAMTAGAITVPWPADLVLYYSRRIPNNKQMVLTSAYQDVPKGAVVELLDNVRNRVLKMALEIRDDLGADLKHMTPAEARQVDRSIVNNIFGGNAYVAAGQVQPTCTRRSVRSRARSVQ